MNKNDDRILELKKQIEEKKKELAKKKVRFAPETNCMLELDNVKYNLNVCTDSMLTVLMLKLHMYVMAANDLGIVAPPISGYAIELWISDIKNKLEASKLKDEEKKLKTNETLLEQLLSEDKKKELILDEIAALLN